MEADKNSQQGGLSYKDKEYQNNELPEIPITESEDESNESGDSQKEHQDQEHQHDYKTPVANKKEENTNFHRGQNENNAQS